MKIYHMNLRIKTLNLPLLCLPSVHFFLHTKYISSIPIAPKVLTLSSIDCNVEVQSLCQMPSQSETGETPGMIHPEANPCSCEPLKPDDYMLLQCNDGTGIG